VPEDESVIIGSNRGAPVVTDPKSRAGQAFRNIGKRLQGEDVPFMDLEPQSTLWKSIQRMAGGRK
jgi:septum site-determining protein MinD